MSKNLYVHTLYGKPASFDGSQICYVCPGGRAKPVDSLKAIKEQRQQSITYRSKKGWKNHSGEYGHFRVSPTPENKDTKE